MLADDLREQLKALEPDVSTIKTFWANAGLENKFIKLQEQSTQEDFWQNPNQTEISKALQKLRLQREQYLTTLHPYTELFELIDLFQDDEVELEKLKIEIRRLEKSIKKLKIAFLLHEEQDDSNCFFSINSGAGGTESQDWANILLRMYLRFCEREKLAIQIIDYQEGEEAGIKSATLFVQGANAYGLLKGEQGIHRLVRISPFDSNKKRHTSFAAATVTPEVPDIEVTIDPKDLRIDTYRSGGAGGQHVNKTDSAVRITHFPSGIVVQCQNERSQIQNREVAMKMLKARLAQKAKNEQAEKNASIEKKKIEWGSQLRSYVLHPYKMVKDHRTETESQQPDDVLDGDLMEFIESYLIWSNKV